MWQTKHSQHQHRYIVPIVFHQHFLLTRHSPRTFCARVPKQKEDTKSTWTRGKRASVREKLRGRVHQTPLSHIILAKVQLLQNQLDKLRSRVQFQRAIWDSNILCLTKTWPAPLMPKFEGCLSIFVTIQRCSIVLSNQTEISKGNFVLRLGKKSNPGRLRFNFCKSGYSNAWGSRE